MVETRRCLGDTGVLGDRAVFPRLQPKYHRFDQDLSQPGVPLPNGLAAGPPGTGTVCQLPPDWRFPLIRFPVEVWGVIPFLRVIEPPVAGVRRLQLLHTAEDGTSSAPPCRLR